MSNPTTGTDVRRTVTNTKTFEGIARTGHVARGVIYILVGLLAVQLARGVTSDAPDQHGAMRALADQRFGRSLLTVLAVGLAAYALWGATEALVGRTPEAGRRNVLDRLSSAGSALSYGALCVAAIAVLTRSSSGTGSTDPKNATADVLGWPAGRILVAVFGIVIIGAAAYQAYFGISRKFLHDSKTGQMTPSTLKGFVAVGMIGLVARAITFGLIGAFLVRAAVEFDSREAVGLDGALRRLTTHSYGPLALGVVACGLIAFGIYSIADARFRKI